MIGSIFGFLNLNLSVDFTGGTTYQLDTEYTDNDIDDVLNNTILPVSRYQTFENSNSILFRAVESTQERETELLNYLSNKFDVSKDDIEFQRVGPTFGAEITSKGLRALVIFFQVNKRFKELVESDKWDCIVVDDITEEEYKKQK